jgi:hypothetical protein
MTPEEYIQNPWSASSSHELYKNSFLNMRPAPEYASGEVLLASLYRNVGFSDIVSEGKVPSFGRDLAKRLEKRRNQEGDGGTGMAINTFKNLMHGALSSPKQTNQTTRRFLQLCPLIPDAAIYSLSARLSTNSWNPGELIARLISFGESDQSKVDEQWSELFRQLSVGPEDDVWARFLNKEFLTWRHEDLRNAWRPPNNGGVWPAIQGWHNKSALIPAAQFVRDLKYTLLLKDRLTRRQWISLVESILRLGAASHVLWWCRAGSVLNNAITGVLKGGSPLTEIELREEMSVGKPFWRYSQAAGRTIRDYASDFVMARLAINLLLWHCEALPSSKRSALEGKSLASIPQMAEFLNALSLVRENIELEEYNQQIHRAIDDNPRVAAGKEGIGSNIGEFLSYVLRQRQTSESGMDSYDQGYFLRKKGYYKTAPWIVSLGPVSVLALVHCCTHQARGPRTVEDFCRHLANYGVEIRAQDVPLSDLGQTLRNLGLVLDSPDAEGGMVLVSPFRN